MIFFAKTASIYVKPRDDDIHYMLHVSSTAAAKMRSFRDNRATMFDCADVPLDKRHIGTVPCRREADLGAAYRAVVLRDNRLISYVSEMHRCMDFSQ